MKNIVTVLSIAAMFTVLAGEREVLLKTFEKENRAAEEVWQNAVTQIEITAAAGNNWNVAESQLLRAMDYKLRHTGAAERLQFLADFHRLSREVQKIYDTPRKLMGGSMAGMQIYNTIALNMQQYIAVLMLDLQSEKRWRKISDATLELNGKEIKLTRGKANFDAVMHDRKIKLQIILFPKDVFAFQNRLFAIIQTDIQFAGNNDFSTIYLCEFNEGKLQVHTKCKFPYLSQWAVTGNIITFFSGNKKEKIQL